jgi:flagellar motor switch protein FliM
MPSEFLSQDEVDALLQGVAGGGDEHTLESSAPKEELPFRQYTLGTQERIIRGRMPTLELINERFVRNLRLGLFNYMHRSMEISVSPIRIQKYSEFIRNLVFPTNLNLVSVKPLRGTSLFVFDPDLVFLVVDNMFGGDGRFHTRVEGREFTPTEQRIIQGLLQVVFTEYEKAWKPVHTLSFEYLRSEMNLQFASIATPSEIVISSSFSIEFAGTTADMHICFPYLMIEPIRDLLHSTIQTDQLSMDQRWIFMLRKQLKDAEIEIVANLASSSITLGQILKMKPGDIIPINIHEKIVATVDDVPLMECDYGQQEGQYALKLDRFLTNEAENASGEQNDRRNSAPSS